ncbi:MarR family winged helix-turn-helix transcriptional regulator [Staphylococcus americanisciuri]|uniref:HTH-type transcriptional regulator MgrA n=1 Tax=Staphylococcus americanisciuri TaxID=2973940 RepID=A0ABT2F3Q4_9STAP|nr:MarR family transcriptional regulator [Staphylococcus americanisciuri]MCS4486447.1 MarR family transcriptional regulator [Staphylococcus americanisciuri]
MSNNPIKEQLCFNLYNAQRQVNRYYLNNIFREHNITYPQYLVLNILWDKSPVNVKKVVTDLSLDTGTISPLLKRMEHMDLITRERSEIDQREVFIHLTQKSKAMEMDLRDASTIVAKASSLTRDEIHELNHLLEKVISGFNESNSNKH